MLRWVLSTVRSHANLGGLRSYSLSLGQRRDGITQVTPSRALKYPAFPAVGNHEYNILAKHLSSDNWSDLKSLPTGLNPKLLYHAVKRSRRSVQLAKPQFQRLLVLYGRLSMDIDRRGRSLDSANASGYWPFVLEVARDMEAMHVLSTADQCWVLRALLGKMRASSSPKYLRQAVRAYEKLKATPNTVGLDLHVDFLKVMIQNKKGGLIRYLSFVLQTQSSLSDQFTTLLWTIVLETCVSAQDQGILTSILHERIIKFKDAGSHLRQSHTLPARVFDSIGRTYHPAVITLDHLRVALGSTVFSTLHASIPSSLRDWAYQHGEAAFSPMLSTETRWQNFVAFTLVEAPVELVQRADAPPAEYPLSNIVVWRTVFALAAIQKFLGELGPDSAAPLRDLIRSLWRRYEALPKDDGEAVRLADRAVVASLLSMSLTTNDSFILDSTHSYIQSRRLWDVEDCYSRRERMQIHSLAMEWLCASIHFRRAELPGALLLLNGPLRDQRAEVMEVLFRKIMLEDVEGTYQLYIRCAAAGVRLSPDTVLAMAERLLLVSPLPVIRLIHNARLPLAHTSRLLRAVLESLYRQAIVRIPPSSGLILIRLLAFFHDAWKNTRPFQFGLCVAARSGHPHHVVALVERLFQTNPALFHPTFVMHLGQILIDRKLFKLASRLWNATKGRNRDLDTKFRRQLVIALAHGRAYALARRLSLSHKGDAREQMLRRVHFRIDRADRAHSLRVLPLAAKSRSIPTITMAIRILTGSRRPTAALRLYARSLGHMDDRARTYIGNIFVHRSINMRGTKNGRLVRRVLEDRDFLASRYGFVQDRVTFNVIVKAILRWRTAVTQDRVRALFDHVVRMGYPVALSWRNDDPDGVPFSTPVGSAADWPLPLLESRIDFKRHVEPLYKLFISAFYVRGDKHAARLVLKILRTEQNQTEG